MADEDATPDESVTDPPRRGRPPKSVAAAAESANEPRADAESVSQEAPSDESEYIADESAARDGYLVMIAPDGFATTVPESIRDALIESGYTDK